MAKAKAAPQSGQSGDLSPTTQEGSEEFEILTKFNGSPDGTTIVEYVPGDVVPNDEKPFPAELAEVALTEGWAKAR